MSTMNNTNGQQDLVNKFLQTLRLEREFLDIFAERQLDLQHSIAKREWARLETSLSSIQNIAAKVENLEKKRIRGMKQLQDTLHLDDSTGFNKMITYLEPENAKKLAGEYRKLKLSLVGVQGKVKGFDSYIMTITSMIKKFMEQLFPHSKGSVYSRCGKKSAADAGSLLVNTHR